MLYMLFDHVYFCHPVCADRAKIQTVDCLLDLMFCQTGMLHPFQHLCCFLHIAWIEKAAGVWLVFQVKETVFSRIWKKTGILRRFRDVQVI